MWLKVLHVCCALLSISGFALRGYWEIAGHPYRTLRLTRVLPHILDTLLLASALGMLWIWGMSPFDASWLSAKIVALLLYIALGIVLMRVAKTRAQRLAAYGGALLVAVYIVCVAVSHSALGPLALL